MKTSINTTKVKRIVITLKNGSYLEFENINSVVSSTTDNPYLYINYTNIVDNKEYVFDVVYSEIDIIELHY